MRKLWCKFCVWLVVHWPGDVSRGRRFKVWSFFLPWAGEAT